MAEKVGIGQCEDGYLIGGDGDLWATGEDGRNLARKMTRVDPGERRQERTGPGSESITPVAVNVSELTVAPTVTVASWNLTRKVENAGGDNGGRHPIWFGEGPSR